MPRWTFVMFLLLLWALPSGAGAALSDSWSSEIQIARDLQALNDRDALVREAARKRLLAMRTSELPELEAAVRRLAPEVLISGVVARTIQDALTHIHIREAKEQRQAEGDDLRLMGQSTAFVGFNFARQAGDNGLVVLEPVPGFVGYEHLEPGDVIIGVRSDRGHSRIINLTTFSAVMDTLNPGDPVELITVRGGRIMRITLRLDRRINTESSEWAHREAAARTAADDVWHERFAPLLRERLEAKADGAQAAHGIGPYRLSSAAASRFSSMMFIRTSTITTCSPSTPGLAGAE